MFKYHFSFPNPIPEEQCSIFENHRYSLDYQPYEQLPLITRHDPNFTEFDGHLLFAKLFCTNGCIDGRKTYAFRCLYTSYYNLDPVTHHVNFCDLPRWKAVFLQYVNVLTLARIGREVNR